MLRGGLLKAVCVRLWSGWVEQEQASKGHLYPSPITTTSLTLMLSTQPTTTSSSSSSSVSYHYCYCCLNLTTILHPPRQPAAQKPFMFSSAIIDIQHYYHQSSELNFLNSSLSDSVSIIHYFQLLLLLLTIQHPVRLGSSYISPTMNTYMHQKANNFPSFLLSL